ncbi:hypothetical protein ODJ79_44860 [Actinoplanes sp. KI2]|uniref:hypothetical protein n=1 Tax=Actinoplanes sp. KI2 TaxID=2983315 RepID=UPI0021D56D71|nr:hypothetical protein [Actinoplanes sp. KI2]MCU7730890.1 hypothetical protein [Actinoplanes sp. KI2]
MRDDDVGDPGLTGEWSTAGCVAPRVPQHMIVGGVAVPVTPAELDAVIGRIEDAGKREFAASFAGIEVDPERVRAIVYRVPSATFDDFVRTVAGDLCVVVRNADHSTEDLAGWHDRVLADLPYWTHHGVRIVSIGARHDGKGVEVGVRDVEEARRELSARYGVRAPLIFMPADPVRPLPVPTGGVVPPPVVPPPVVPPPVVPPPVVPPPVVPPPDGS